MKDAKGHGSDGRGGSLAPRAQNELDFARRVPKPGHEAAFAAENKATSDASTAAARSAFASMHDDLSHTGAEHVAALGDAHGLPMQHGQGGDPALRTSFARQIATASPRDPNGDPALRTSFAEDMAFANLPMQHGQGGTLKPRDFAQRQAQEARSFGRGPHLK